jgi:hypothetical protein
MATVGEIDISAVFGGQPEQLSQQRSCGKPRRLLRIGGKRPVWAGHPLFQRAVPARQKTPRGAGVAEPPPQAHVEQSQ